MGSRKKQTSDSSSQDTCPPSVKVSVCNRQKILPISKSSVRQVVGNVLQLEECKTHEVGIYFVSKKEIGRLHEEFFNDPTPTDCISFPIDADYLGDIFVCPEVAIEYAGKTKRNTSYTEMTLYLVHGLLHLLGYNDIKKEERKIMQKAQRRLMQHLAQSDVLIK